MITARDVRRARVWAVAIGVACSVACAKPFPTAVPALEQACCKLRRSMAMNAAVSAVAAGFAAIYLTTAEPNDPLWALPAMYA
jgi:hypothetical protein